ncbi:RNA-guided endonuclease InsQ/TnpB family protein [Candidatus Methanodesulfokora washburnensis]|uniref:RNA-guided endonuclease InsQ/TnpB family protein n=1 Tax=Candidatus Methanodesulfokora washburnensis TaxID=2478471 RepID=UPI001F48E9F0|nr:transposase [Candidatus Methanodesulfokores washburnensis]
MPLETVKLTASFKLNGSIPESLFSMYGEVLNQLLDFAWMKGITSFKRLKAEKYYEMRMKYPSLPSHYIYTACQMACSIYRSFRKLKRRGLAKAEKPYFKKQVLMLDDHLFSLDLERWEASIATEHGRIRVKLLHGTYHEKFKDMKAGEAWILRKNNEFYLNICFSKTVKLMEQDNKAIAVDINENNVAFGSTEGIVNFKTEERAIRTAYFLKRKRIQLKLGSRGEMLMEKYRGREKRRIEDIYHKLADKIVEKAREDNATTIILERLTNIRRRIRYSRAVNGRLHRWSFRRLQKIIEYKAKLAGLNVVYVNARGTSTLCPICREKLSPNGHRLMRCPKCGLEEDRDVIAVRNLLKLRDVGSSSVHPEGPIREGMKVNARPERTFITRTIFFPSTSTVSTTTVTGGSHPLNATSSTSLSK